MKFAHTDVNHMPIFRAAKAVRDNHTIYHKWCKNYNDSELDAAVMKAEARFYALEEVLRANGRLWKIVRICEHAGVDMTGNLLAGREKIEHDARIFQRAYDFIMKGDEIK